MDLPPESQSLDPGYWGVGGAVENPVDFEHNLSSNSISAIYSLRLNLFVWNPQTKVLPTLTLL